MQINRLEVRGQDRPCNPERIVAQRVQDQDLEHKVAGRVPDLVSDGASGATEEFQAGPRPLLLFGAIWR